MWKQCWVSIKAKLNQVVEDLENHEAVAEAVIDDLKKLRATVHLQATRLRRQEQRLDTKLASLLAQAEQWKRRARDIADQDREKALACVQRLKDIERDIEQVEAALSQTRSALAQVKKELNEIDDNLHQMNAQLAVLRSRESRIQVCNRIEGDESALDGFRDIFDRWESRLDSEDSFAGTESIDPLEEDFQRQEDKQDLEDTLERLLKSTGEST